MKIGNLPQGRNIHDCSGIPTLTYSVYLLSQNFCLGKIKKSNKVNQMLNYEWHMKLISLWKLAVISKESIGILWNYTHFIYIANDTYFSYQRGWKNAY